MTALALATGAAAQAPESPPSPLPPYTVSSTRTPAEVFAVGNFVEQLDPDEIAVRQLPSLAAALSGLAGINPTASGAPGGITSVFVRGSNSNQTLFLVDGIRMNDSNTDYAVFLGGACISACDSLEVAHGPLSTLYGGEAVGGVVSLRSEPGRGKTVSRATIEAGSFGTVQTAVASRGARGAWSHNIAAQGGRTDNHRPNNQFTSGNVTARLDREINPGLSVGATFRGFWGAYGSPGSRFVNDPDNDEREHNLLATAFAAYAVSDRSSGRVLVGGQNRRFVSENPGANGTQTTVVRNRRAVLDWQHSIEMGSHRVTGGPVLERLHTVNTGFGDIDERQSLWAVFVQDEWTIVEDQLTITAGLRSDDHDTFGRATTGRVAVAWMAMPRRLKVRSSYGTAFRSPGFLDLFGTSAFYEGNPDLRPEKSKGWDAGVDFYLPEGRGVASLTWFEAKQEDLIVFDFSVFPGTTANVERARNSGIEAVARMTLPAGFQTRCGYAWLDARNLSQDNRLLRRPRHRVNADVWLETDRWTLGVGAATVVGREDVHAATFNRIDMDDFAVVRLYGSWRASERLTFKARVENLLDQVYEEVHGFPQPRIGGYAGVEWIF